MTTKPEPESYMVVTFAWGTPWHCSGRGMFGSRKAAQSFADAIEPQVTNEWVGITVIPYSRIGKVGRPEGKQHWTRDRPLEVYV